MLDGRQPEREEIQALAQRLRLKEQQIYKWFWDTQKKVKEDEQTAIELGKDKNLVRNENGSSTVRQWMQHRDCQGWEGSYGNGASMNPIDIKTALKTYE